MARIQKYGDNIPQNLSSFDTFVVDTNPNSDYFRITEFKEAFTGGKNGFLIEGSQHLLESTDVKIEILDVDGNPMYWEPGNGIPEYYEGISKVVAVYVYEDTPIGEAKITILGELKTYVDATGVTRDIPDAWKGIFNVKWEKTFKVNKNLANEDKVRFYKRPVINIDEISRPIFTATPIVVTQTGFISGTPLIPNEGASVTNFSLPTSYLLTISDTSNWSGSILNGGTISVPSLNATFLPSDLVNNKELLVSNPYTENGLAKSFTNKAYTATFNYLQEDTALGTALSGSFAKININNLTTFVGDVARVKVFRKSQSEVSDYQFVQEIPLESNEILVDLASSQRNQENYGLFTPYTLANYWVTSSNNLTTTYNQNFLYNSVKLDSVGVTRFYTSKSIDITEGVEYTLDMNIRLTQNISGDNYVKVYLEGTKDAKTITQEITTISSSNPYLQKTNINENIKAYGFDSVKLYFEVKGSGWYISDVSLRASQETSFSPDEITFIQPIPRNLESETFDFRFEFYDINNNYIPVLVENTKTFSGGNLNKINKSVSITPSQLYFQFDSGSGTGNPIDPKVLFITAETAFITGSITFTSRSFDFNNNELSASQYAGGQYPGLLDVIEPEKTYRLTVENFTGSRNDINVQYVEYVASVEGVSDSTVITRVSDGKGGVNYEIRPYNGITIKNSHPSSSLEVQAIRIDGTNEVNLKSGLPLGKSDYKLFVQSGSTYITLTEASTKGYILALQPGITGSGELDYNARFNRDSINGQITLYLIPSSSNNYSASILTSLTLTDLQDGLDSGTVLFEADKFSINPSPKIQAVFNPISSSVTASFYKRGQTTSPISCSLEIYPSMSLNSDFVAEYWINYVTHSCDPYITVVAYDEVGNVIPSISDAATYQFGLPLSQNKQLLTSFTYNEPWTSASVNVNHLFQIIPDGLPGAEPISIIVDPVNVVLKSNENGDVLDHDPSITSIKVKQGNDFLIYDNGNLLPPVGGAGNFNTDGLFSIITATGTDVTYTGIQSTTDTTVITNPVSDFINTTGTIQYDIKYQPFYTSSILTASFVQSYTKVADGRAARKVSIAASSQTVNYDGDGVVISPDGDIVLTATAYNTTGSAYFEYFKNDIQITPPTSINFGGNSLALSSGDAAQPGETAVFKVKLRDGSGDPNDVVFAEDQITITGVESGANPYNVSLTNENSSIFADVYGEITFTGTGTEIIATKGVNSLTAVTAFSTPTFDQLGTVIPNGEYKATLFYTSSHITPANTNLTLGSTIPVVGGIASIGNLTAWNYLRNTSSLQPLSASAEIVYEIDLEDGKAVYYKTQSLSVQYEGAIGPGLIMRGVWSASIDYEFDVANKRRDSVIYPGSINATYYYASLEKSGPNTYYNSASADYYIGSTPPSGYNLVGYQAPPTVVGEPTKGTKNQYWEYLGKEEFFVAAKLAIFEESFVKNTINVGNNGGTEKFANIVLAGGRIDPYIAVGQTGTVGASGDQTTAGVIGYGNTGIFLGTKVTGSAVKTPMMSLVNSGASKYMLWDGSSLIIKGDITADNGTFNGTVNAAAGNFTGYVTAGNMRIGANVESTNDGLYINANNFWYDTGNAFKMGNSTSYLQWDGNTLILRGSIKQTDAGVNEPTLKGTWAAGITYYNNDVVSYSGQAWICTSATSHVSTNDTNATTGYPGSGPWSVYVAKGTNGADGANGPAIVYRGVYDAAKIYYHNTTRRDVVASSLVSPTYYLANNTAKNGLATWGTPPTDWTTFGAQFSSVATDILLAQNANIYQGLVIGTDGTNSGYIRSTGATSLTAGDGFYMDQAGNMRFGQATTTTGAKYVSWDTTLGSLTVKGQLITDNSQLGNWLVDGDILRDTTSTMQLNPNIPAIEIYDGTDKKLDIKQGAITDPEAGAIALTVDPPLSNGFSSVPYYSFPGSGTKVISTSYDTVTVTKAGQYKVAGSWVSSNPTFISTGATPFYGNAYILLYIGFYETTSPSTTSPIATVGLATSDVLGGAVGGTPGGTFLSLNANTFDTTVSLPVGTFYVYTIWQFMGGGGGSTITLNGNYDPAARSFNLQYDQIELTDSGLLVIAGAQNYIKIERGTNVNMIDVKQNSATYKGLRIQNGAGGGYFNNSSLAIDVPAGGVNITNKLFVQGMDTNPTGVTNEAVKVITSTGARKGELFISTSTRRDKKDIVDWDKVNILDKIKLVPPKKFRYKNWPDTAELTLGMIAEDLRDAGLEEAPMFEYDETGQKTNEVRSIDWEKISVILWKAVQELTERIEALENK